MDGSFIRVWATTDVKPKPRAPSMKKKVSGKASRSLLAWAGRIRAEMMVRLRKMRSAMMEALRHLRSEWYSRFFMGFPPFLECAVWFFALRILYHNKGWRGGEVN